MAVGMDQGVAGLAPRPFSSEEETGSHHMVIDTHGQDGAMAAANTHAHKQSGAWRTAETHE